MTRGCYESEAAVRMGAAIFRELADGVSRVADAASIWRGFRLPAWGSRLDGCEASGLLS
jgi:hypothetical protein